MEAPGSPLSDTAALFSPMLTWQGQRLRGPAGRRRPASRACFIGGAAVGEAAVALSPKQGDVASATGASERAHRWPRSIPAAITTSPEPSSFLEGDKLTGPGSMVRPDSHCAEPLSTQTGGCL